MDAGCSETCNKRRPGGPNCLGGLQSWSKGRWEVNIMSRSNTSYWNKLMRVQNGVLENESISYSCQTWCLTTSDEWVNNHCYFVSFEHSVSLQVLHSHSNRPCFKFLGGIPPKCAWIKHWRCGLRGDAYVHISQWWWWWWWHYHKERIGGYTFFDYHGQGV